MMRAVAAGNKSPGSGADELADAILAASRLLVRLSAGTLHSSAPELNLSEFRTLVILSENGPQRLIDIAAALDVTSTTVTRLADRLADHGFVERVRDSRDRREIYLSIAASGRDLVRVVSSQRRRFVTSVLREFPERDQVAALKLINRLIASASAPAEENAS
ncbi:MAG TPA: MarR family transcriptional regulator [Acidimicrobiales bacterium]|nr:MarR family transcriptional regulator [Acidimicrobiales bacterium]